MKRMNFKTSMLEYGKIVLSKMAFDRKLFRKEYRKLLRHLAASERQQLKVWVRGSLKLAVAQ
ncbi:MAG TPA: hypothetical protein VGD65_03805 [Chryseosolibacter sp.]